MKLKKIFTYNNNKQIWRIIPSETNKVLLEERTDDKQVYFTCLDLNSGKKIFSDFQFDEKYWIGIEAVYNDIIYFHKYARPDMPGHKGIYAVDLFTLTELWRNEDYIFSFIYEDKILCLRHLFESREYFSINYLTGDVIPEPVYDNRIDEIKNSADAGLNYNSYKYPERWNELRNADASIEKILNGAFRSESIVGDIDYIYFDSLLMMSYNISESDDLFKNKFRVLEVNSGKVIFEEILVEHSRTMMPDSFFMKDDFLFVLKGKNCFGVFLIIK